MSLQIDRFIPVSKLKYYFAVDTVYVGKKLGLLVFPYLHQDWEVQYQQDTPVAPRFDINAPDLYIPGCPLPTLPRHVWDGCLGACAREGLPSSDECLCLSSTAMAFITYILVAGLALGTQDR